MIERIYIDNFRCFVNCEIKLQPITLLMGVNGVGKSSVQDVIIALKSFLTGAKSVGEVFPASDLTRWQSLGDQRFELDVRFGDHLYLYVLIISFTPDRKKCRVNSEKLSMDGAPLFEFNNGEMQLYNDLHTAGPRLSFDWNRSGLSAINPRHDNKKLTGFLELVRKIGLLRPNPFAMENDSQEEEEQLAVSGKNFPSWYRYVSRQSIKRQSNLFTELAQVIDGFEELTLAGAADSTTTLRVHIRPGGGELISYKISELSEGYRQLLLLHTVLFGVNEGERILFLDEPDNFLSLREVEPWLVALMDATGRQGIDQSILISHHPGVVDHLAAECGVWLQREQGGPTRVEYGLTKVGASLKPSEQEARGW